MKIRSKAEFFRLSRAGVLGNTIRQWADPAEAAAARVPWYGIRAARGGGGGSHWVVMRKGLKHALAQWRRSGVPFIVDETAPDGDVTLQGEVSRGVGGWTGTLGMRSGMRMREAMAAGLLRPMRGLAVKVLLDTFVDPSSREDIDALLELYPDAVIEFACYTRDVGVIPGRNTVIWEVRDY